MKSAVFPYADNSDNELEALLNMLALPLRGHSRRVSICCAIMTEQASEFTGLLDIPAGVSLPSIAHAGGSYHDIGKLLMPNRDIYYGTDEKDYRQHPVVGAELLEKNKKYLFENGRVAQIALDMVRYHHERPDGKGYPGGLGAKDIPLLAGICALAEELDSRIYMKFESCYSIFNELHSQAGSAFCESAVICLERAYPQLMVQYVKWNRGIA